LATHSLRVGARKGVQRKPRTGPRRSGRPLVEKKNLDGKKTEKKVGGPGKWQGKSYWPKKGIPGKKH